MNQKEVKFSQRHMMLDVLSTSHPSGALGTSQYTTPGALNGGACNQWMCLGYQTSDTKKQMIFPRPTTDSALSGPTKSTGRGYNDSPFALIIPQGTGALERVGRDVSVIRDDWFIRFMVPMSIPGYATEQTLTRAEPYRPDFVDHYVQRVIPTASLGTLAPGNRDSEFDLGHNMINENLGQRPMRVRMVCIFQDQVDLAGVIGFHPSQLFASQYDIHSRFSKVGASGYKVIYDKTKTFVPQGAQVSMTTADQNETNRQNSYKTDLVFRLNTKYLRRYEGQVDPDEIEGKEVAHDESNVIVGGVSRGALTWYFFIEDQYCAQHASSGTPATSVLMRHETHTFYQFEVNRKTLWVDP